MFKVQKEFQGDNKATTTNAKFIATGVISKANISYDATELYSSIS
jgi:hypothetical protein